MPMKTLVLASGSPRRKQLLETLNIPFSIEVSDFDEVMDMTKNPHELAKELALGKARDVAKEHKDAVILAADTFIVLDNEYLGKPKDEKDNIAMLGSLSGKTHSVITGFAIIDTKTRKVFTQSVESSIFMKHLTNEQVTHYVKEKKPFDKSGGYAIQEIKDTFVEKIEGGISNIIGLPILQVKEALKQFGIEN